MKCKRSLKCHSYSFVLEIGRNASSAKLVISVWNDANLIISWWSL